MCDKECQISKIKTILGFYKNTSYIELYGTQLAIFIFLIVFEVIVLIILSFKKNILYYQEHWTDLRCEPTIMPFAGFINKPDGISFITYTQENYNYCNQKGIDKQMDEEFQPLYGLQINSNKNLGAANNNVGAVTKANNEKAAGIEETANVGADKMTKMFTLINYWYTLFMSFFSNISDIMTGFFQFSLTGVTWSTMFIKILSKAFLIILIIFFVVTVIPTVPLWILIFPLIYFILFVLVLVIVFKFNDYGSIITSSMEKFEPFTLMKNKIKPKISLCFDEKTRIKMIKGSKSIKKINVGDILQGGEIVTATFKTIAPSTMFNFNGIIVSGDHYVFENEWIKVRNHPESVEIKYHKKFLYCLNTTNKKIKIKNYEFMDWDELDEKKKKIITRLKKCREDEIHSCTDKGYPGNLMVKTKEGYKRMFHIQPGDILFDGSKIMAKVTIKGDDIIGKHRHFKIYNVVTNTGFFKNKRDYNFIIDKLFYMP